MEQKKFLNDSHYAENKELESKSEERDTAEPSLQIRTRFNSSGPSLPPIQSPRQSPSLGPFSLNSSLDIGEISDNCR